MDWDYPTPFTRQLTVSGADIDGMGHVNNACYVVWCEDCAWKHSEALGLSVEDYQRLDRGVSIHRANYEYLLPSFENDSLTIATWLTDCDCKLRLERSFQIINTATEQTVLRGSWQLICTALSTGKAVRLPQEFLNTYGAAVIPTPQN
ncbi:MAG: thioesterase family protein [Gammaproteobacteria bacterium]|jgi:acyl-CoA thioester hydrolase|nr:thioesterase family protein [Gammaproteobacteria bacterium]MDP6534903.1 thioesterase family protein [Gammaproteobacteria bacterium]MDP6731980.1 thioesterase family protein [Gammaproteobacteria bacterium]HAJ76352.1 acyl-CoA thioesterase [Gammaproteobacteria bacterium]